MTKDILKTILDIPGIYKITNDINGKCYIGQTIFLKRRIKRHLEYKNHKCNMLIYKAFDKYGIHNFSIDVLESFDTNDYTAIKPILDKLEIKYIQDFNSYRDGYNQTIGGDAGITGYKFTEKQRQRVSTCAKSYAHHYYKPVYLKSVITKYTKMYISETHAASDLNCAHSQIARVCERKQMLLNKEWIGGRSYEDLNLRYSEFLSYRGRHIGKKKFTIKEYYNFLKDFDDGNMPSTKQIKQAANICRKTISTYNEELLRIGLLKEVKYHKYELI